MCSDLDYGSIIGTVIHTTSVPASLQAEFIEHDKYIEITEFPKQYRLLCGFLKCSECNYHHIQIGAKQTNHLASL